MWSRIASVRPPNRPTSSDVGGLVRGVLTINLMFPGIALALAVGCTMAALTAAALPAPFMITIVVLLVTGIPAIEGIPVLLATVAAHGIKCGFGFLPRSE